MTKLTDAERADMYRRQLGGTQKALRRERQRADDLETALNEAAGKWAAADARARELESLVRDFDSCCRNSRMACRSCAGEECAYRMDERMEKLGIEVDA